MHFEALLTNQAPSLSAPLRYFLTAPIFGILAGIFIFFSDAQTLMSRYSLDSIIITHVITIGFFAFVMLGAMMQMLPVLIGAKIPKIEFVARHSYELLILGLVMMILGFYLDSKIYNLVALVSLGSGFGIVLFAIVYSLKDIKNITATFRAITTSILFAIFIVIIGLILLYGYVDGDISDTHHKLANIHSVLAVFGFAGVLIIGVAFQVLPMFYITPHFKRFCKRYVVWLITLGLVVWSVLNSFENTYTLVGKFWISLFFLAFATTVWLKLKKRKRPRSDVTIWYWRAASIYLTLGTFVWIFDQFFKEEYIVMVAILIGGGFILSIMIGMLYKIIPFLVWLHLNEKGYMNIPSTNEMIKKQIAQVQFIFLMLALIGFIFSFYIPDLLQGSAVLFIISMFLLEYTIISPILIYRKMIQTKPDTDINNLEIVSGA